MKNLYFSAFACFLFSNYSSFAQIPDWAWTKSPQETASHNQGDYFFDYSTAIAVDNHQNLFLTGTFDDSLLIFDHDSLIDKTGPSRMFIAKYDASGKAIWERKTAGSSAVGSTLCTDTRGDIYVGGFFISPTIVFGTDTFRNETRYGRGFGNLFLVKYNSSGQVQWARNSASGYTIRIQAMVNDQHGNICIAGNYYGPIIVFGHDTLTNSGKYKPGRPYSPDIFVVEYDSSGNLLWARNAGGAGGEYVTGITSDNQGDIYVCGDFTSQYCSFGNLKLHTNGTVNENFLVKYNAAGNPVWAKNGSGGSNSSNCLVASDPSAFLYFTGVSDSEFVFGNDSLKNLTSGNQYLLKLDSSGKVVWARNLGLSQLEEVYVGEIATDASGESYLTGSFYGNTVIIGNDTIVNHDQHSFGDDIFIMKCDSQGNFLWAKGVGGNSYDDPSGLAIDSKNNVYLSGNFSSSKIAFGEDSVLYTGFGEDIFVAKLNADPGFKAAPALKQQEIQNISSSPWIYSVNHLLYVQKVGPDLMGGALTVQNELGQSVFSQVVVSASNIIDLKSQPTGIYFISLIKDGEKVEKKVILN